MPQSFVSAHYHVMFSTKARTASIDGAWRERLYEYVGGILRELKSPLLAAGGIPDHVHLLVSLSKELAISDAMRVVKTHSSGWIHDTFPSAHDFAWQAGYGAFTVSYSNLSRVKQYIANQAEHHRARDFKDEFRVFLRRHGIEFDERYIWD